jgi:hypothetical protein
MIDHEARADRMNLDDVHEALAEIERAEAELMRAMDGKGGQTARSKFAFCIGVARGRLGRVIARLYGEERP